MDLPYRFLSKLGPEAINNCNEMRSSSPSPKNLLRQSRSSPTIQTSGISSQLWQFQAGRSQTTGYKSSFLSSAKAKHGHTVVSSFFFFNSEYRNEKGLEPELKYRIFFLKSCRIYVGFFFIYLCLHIFVASYRILPYVIKDLKSGWFPWSESSRSRAGSAVLTLKPQPEAASPSPAVPPSVLTLKAHLPLTPPPNPPFLCLTTVSSKSCGIKTQLDSLPVGRCAQMNPRDSHLPGWRQDSEIQELRRGRSLQLTFSFQMQNFLFACLFTLRLQHGVCF